MGLTPGGLDLRDRQDNTRDNLLETFGADKKKAGRTQPLYAQIQKKLFSQHRVQLHTELLPHESPHGGRGWRGAEPTDATPTPQDARRQADTISTPFNLAFVIVTSATQPMYTLLRSFSCTSQLPFRNLSRSLPKAAPPPRVSPGFSFPVLQSSHARPSLASTTPPVNCVRLSSVCLRLPD